MFEASTHLQNDTYDPLFCETFTLIYETQHYVILAKVI